MGERAATTEHDRIHERVERGHAVEAFLLEQALASWLTVALGSILSGSAAYGTGTNIGLGAERLALAAAPVRAEGPDGPEGPDAAG